MANMGAIARGVVFAVTVVVVVSVIAIPPLLTDSSPAEVPEHPEYSVSNLVPQRADSTGQISVQPASDSGTVLIDLAHRNRITTEQLQPLTAAITAAGYQVEFLTDNEELGTSLSRADAFVVIVPGESYTRAEADRVESFVESGGRLAMFGEPSQSAIQSAGLFAILAPISNNLGTLSTRFGIEFGEGYLYNLETNDGNHQNILARSSAPRALTRDVDQTALFLATSVETRTGTPLLTAVEGTHSARGDIPGEYPVAVVDGNVLAIGDATFLQRGNFNVVNNEQFLSNVVSFLVRGDPQRTLLDYPAVVGPEPTVRYTSAGLIDAAQRISNDLGQRGRQPTVQLRRQLPSPTEADVLITSTDFLEDHGNDVPGTRIRARDGRIALPDYESNATGIAVIHAPANGFDLVIVVDGPLRANRAAAELVDGQVDQYAISGRTAVIRTSSSVPEKVVQPPSVPPATTSTPPANVTTDEPTPVATEAG